MPTSEYEYIMYVYCTTNKEETRESTMMFGIFFMHLIIPKSPIKEHFIWVMNVYETMVGGVIPVDWMRCKECCYVVISSSCSCVLPLSSLALHLRVSHPYIRTYNVHECIAYACSSEAHYSFLYAFGAPVYNGVQKHDYAYVCVCTKH